MIDKINFAIAVRAELIKKNIFCTGLSGRVCRRPEQKSFTSSGRYISLFFTSNTNMLSGRGMTLLFTAFNDGKLLAKSSPRPPDSPPRYLYSRLLVQGTNRLLFFSFVGLSFEPIYILEKLFLVYAQRHISFCESA